MPLPTNRTVLDTIEEHLDDHNILNGQHNELEGHADATTGVHGIADTTALALADHDHDGDYDPAGAATVAVAALVDSAPGTLDTLNELAAALGDDANFASTVTTSLAGKSDTGHTHSAYVPLAEIDAKGDLLVGSTADTLDNLGVGTDGQVLTADSAQTLGVKWAVAGGTGDGVGEASIFTSGRYSARPHGNRGVVIVPLENLQATPIWLPRTLTVDRIACEVTTAGTTGSVVRLGIYADNGGKPGALLLETSALSTTTTGVKEATISQQLTVGLWWLAIVSQVAAPTCRAIPATSGAISLSEVSPSSSLVSAIYQNNVTGALPNPFTGALALFASSAALIWLRTA